MEQLVAAGQGDLRRQQQLRRLAHRAGATRRPRRGTSSASCRSRASTTSTPARSSWRCCRRAAAYGLGVIPWSPLGGGLLGGALQKAAAGPALPRADAAARSSSTATAARGVGGALRASSAKQPADVALAWLLHNPVVTAPIIGPRTMEQLDGALARARDHLDQDELTRARRDLARPRRRGARGLRLVRACPGADSHHTSRTETSWSSPIKIDRTAWRTGWRGPSRTHNQVSDVAASLLNVLSCASSLGLRARGGRTLLQTGESKDKLPTTFVTNVCPSHSRFQPISDDIERSRKLSKEARFRALKAVARVRIPSGLPC